jgi:hypothetical protein
VNTLSGCLQQIVQIIDKTVSRVEFKIRGDIGNEIGEMLTL